LGGSHGSGTVFKIAKSAAGYASSPSQLFSFNIGIGELPLSGLISDATGNLFGTTSEGGANCPNGRHCGTVFEISKTVGGDVTTLTTLVTFCVQPDCADGAGPQSALFMDAKGNLFGTTYLGGVHSQGTVFEIVETTGGYAPTPTTLVSFSGADGANPSAGLIADADGNLLGTTFHGGAYGLGTVFEIAKTANGYAPTPTTLVSFSGADGANASAGLIADADGNLFGTTIFGGSSSNCVPLLTNGCGTVFRVAKTANGYANTPTVLINFNLANGAYPSGGLISDTRGNLFGMTEKGGAYCPYVGCGTLFELTGTGFVSAKSL
jgi:uncharacterized repeat protein (TIGR03803 family)